MSDKTSTHAAQARTLEVASKHGDHWTQAELDYLSAHRDDPREELAAHLGRTLYAVWQAFHAGLDERREKATAAARPLTAWDRGFTSLADMGW